jgi:hypothetical protein
MAALVASVDLPTPPFGLAMTTTGIKISSSVSGLICLAPELAPGFHD